MIAVIGVTNTFNSWYKADGPDNRKRAFLGNDFSQRAAIEELFDRVFVIERIHEI